MKKGIHIFVVIAVFLSVTGCEARRAPEPAAPAAAGSPRLSELLRGESGAGFPLVETPREFVFPDDHGPHREFRNEWWYLTGNLDADDGRRFGYELTLFRFALAPSMPAADGPRSEWRSNQVFVGHFAVSDVAAGRFHVAERVSREALGLAGATGPPVRVWLEDWSLSQVGATAGSGHGDAWQLHAGNQGVDVSLVLDPLLAPVANGAGGISHKSSRAGDATYYYSVPRLETKGTITVDHRTHRVSGLSWLDREWGSRGLSPQQQGWDWFALQLDDGSNLMFYQLRRTDGTRDPSSAGTWISRSGESTHLANEDLAIVVRKYWDSPLGGRYPMAWTLRLPREGLELELEPVLDAQELDTRVRYWEGAVDVRGKRGDKPINGRGYVELTGYAADSS